MRKILFMFFILSWLTTSTFAQEGQLDIRVNLDQTIIRKSEPFHLTVICTGRQALTENMKLIPGKFAGFRLIGISKSTSLYEENNIQMVSARIEYQLVPIATGRREIQPLVVEYHDPASRLIQSVRSRPISIIIQGNEDRLSEKTGYFFRQPVLIGTAGALMAGAGFFLFRRRRRRYLRERT
ncbi:MAG: protein BatD [Nitrospirae bacterium]|nr:protein BatD [Nitrospirota bacterium]